MSSSDELGEDALAMLTDEERAAIEDGKPTPEDVASLQAIAGRAVDDDDGDGDGDEKAPAADPAAPAPAADAPAADAAKAAAAKAAEPSAEATEPPPQPTPPAAFQVQYKAPLPEDYQSRRTELADKTAGIAKQFKDGDIDFDEYQVQRAALDDERETLLLMRAKAEISQETTAQSAEQTWANAVSRFMVDVARAEGVDYTKDKARADDLDMFVKSLANNPAHEARPMEWFLSEAHKRVNALHGAVTPPTPVDPKAAIAAAKSARAPTPSAAPKTLAQVPGAGGAGDIAGEFADIDALEGDDLEAAIARMTPTQREKFAQGQ